MTPGAKMGRRVVLVCVRKGLVTASIVNIVRGSKTDNNVKTSEEMLIFNCWNFK